MKTRTYVYFTDILFLLTAFLGWQQHVSYKDFYQKIFSQYKAPVIILNQPVDIGLVVFIVSTAGFIVLTTYYLLGKDKEKQEAAKKQRTIPVGQPVKNTKTQGKN